MSTAAIEDDVEDDNVVGGCASAGDDVRGNVQAAKVACLWRTRWSGNKHSLASSARGHRFSSTCMRLHVHVHARARVGVPAPPARAHLSV